MTTPEYKDSGKSASERAVDLVSRMTLEEKIKQTVYTAPAIERLDVPDYNWWNECLHGVARAGVATVFPQAIGIAATFDAKLMKRVAATIADEGRAKHHEFDKKGDHGIYKGLTFWTPNINIFRDPRWGRGQETYGEDPYLTSRLGVAFVKGLQGDNPTYFKAIATPKHYAVHSGPEPLRHEFDAVIDEKTLRETYLPAFRACVVEAGAYSVMGAYNRTNGEVCCGSSTLLEKILRDEWGFQGYVVSDCGAISDFHLHHKITKDAAESAAYAVKNGCDLNCGKTYPALTDAVERGLISEEEIDVAVIRLFTARFKLGMFDTPEEVPFASIPYEVNGSKKHRDLSRKCARDSFVLLKNNGILPLREAPKSVAVIGPNADERNVIIGNYFGTPAGYVTALDGFRNRVGDAGRVWFAEGCHLYRKEVEHWGDLPEKGFAEAIAAAERSEVAFLCLGLSPELEGEEGAVANSDGGGDRTDLGLPGMQQQLLEAVVATGTPVVLLLFNGSPVDISWAQENVDAILDVWYPGEEAGTAITDVVFGEYSPSGRLPLTFPRSLKQLPPFTEYSMKGRTYRYMTESPLYPFGFGLSYSSFEYLSADVGNQTSACGDVMSVSVRVKNTGEIDADEIVELYLSRPDARHDGPIRQLVGATRVETGAGETEEVTFDIDPRWIAEVRPDGRHVVYPGSYELSIGGCQPDVRSAELGATKGLQVTFNLDGDEVVLPL
jgi:beta-glucosidase